MTLEELKALYAEKGATQQRVTPSEQGDIIDYIPVQLGEGWTAYEKQPTEIVDYIGQGMDATPIYKQLAPEEKLGGFTKQEGDYVTTYDLNGKVIDRHKWNESDFKTMWNDLGPIIMAAGSTYLGGIPLGETGLTAANAVSAAKAIDSGNPLGFLSSISGALDQAGVNLDGMSTKDVLKYIGLANTVTGGAISNALGGGSSSNTGSGATPATQPQPSSDPSVLALLAGNQQPQVIQTASQDPYTTIKSMEDVFGSDIAYKLKALGAPRNLASTDLDALARLLRNQNV